MEFFITFVKILFDILIFVLFIRVILSWIYPFGHVHGNRLVALIFEMSEPALVMARKVPHRIGMLDISPIVAFIMLEILRSVIIYLLTWIALNI